MVKDHHALFGIDRDDLCEAICIQISDGKLSLCSRQKGHSFSLKTNRAVTWSQREKDVWECGGNDLWLAILIEICDDRSGHHLTIA